MKPKKKGVVGARKSRSRGLWIAPDLERMIKGEGGRRGLSDPPYGYFLQLADLVLKSAASNPPAGLHKPVAGDLAGNQAIERNNIESGAKRAPRPKAKARRSSAESPRRPPAFGPPKPRKLCLPKPQHPKPAKQTLPKPPRRSVPKLSIPKPPKQGR